MSGLEVVGAVAAVVSAFHGGAELISHIKKKHRRRSSKSQTQQDFEEKQLQQSLEKGENQVQLHYSSDVRELGNIMRVGDAIARDRLLHIALVMQAEIIKSLQLAVKYENAILNLNILYEASIMNRNETIVTLGELKQRLRIARPFPRTLVSAPEDSPEARSLSGSLPTHRTADLPSIPDNYIPSAVTIPMQGGSKEMKTGFARYFNAKRSHSQPHRDLLQGANDHATVMKDIDEIIYSYRGLQVDQKRDTLDILSNGYGYGNTARLHHDEIQRLNNSHSIQKELNENPEYPPFKQNIFDSHHQAYGQYMPTKNAVPHVPGSQQSRWSATSSVHSDPPSLYRNDSTSTHSRDSVTPDVVPDCSPRGSVGSTGPFTSYETQRQRRAPNATSVQNRTQTPPIAPDPLSKRPMLNSSAPNIPASSNTSPPIALESLPTRSHSPPPPRTPPKDDDVALKADKPRAKILAGVSHARNKSAPDPSVILASVAAAVATSIAPPSSRLAPGISQNSHGPLHIRTGSIQGPVAGLDTMMSGRPCKDNNYWGFCKGAWAVREETKRGLGLQTRPDGMYNSHQIWQCKHCNFQGDTFSAPHPTRKNKKETVVDPSIYTSAVGIRYRWIFLAKSHVKKKTVESGGRINKRIQEEDCNYGCVICSNEGNVTGIYGNVETLMNHIFLEHVQSMNERVCAKSRCVMGRMAAAEEDWDLNIPMTDILTS
ncbi:hypothetical protein BS50DRAFT_391996 [Corynespora cassiicola Philippines]|uniref:Uncharacterized protein n=1 Tax=Corynespora cassiicola Philippines TaxID=1448308 RepID=A0A2T2NPT1_CORCC|nr:hypothetical protein BS50DRAFT_391996 [Corynespora cassiicola Philippines]